MIKGSIVTVLGLILCTSLLGQQADWAIQWGPSASPGSSSKYCDVYSVVVDQAGNTYATGRIAGAIDMDPGPGVLNIGSGVLPNIFVSKLDSNGSLGWAIVLGGSGLDQGQDIALDAFGNLYVTGRFEGTVDFDYGPGNFTLSSPGVQAGFVLQIDTGGVFGWAAAIQGTDIANGHEISLDHSGHLVVVGEFQGICDLDPDTSHFDVNSGGIMHVYATKWDTSGHFLWGKDIPARSLYYEQVSVAVDGNDNVLVTGCFMDSSDYDPGVDTFAMEPIGIDDAFVMKLDANGEFVWVKQFGGTSSAVPQSIDVDAQGAIYFAGWFQDIVDFDPDTTVFNVTSAGYYDLFIGKLTDDGRLVWVKGIGNNDFQVVRDLVVNPVNGHVVTVGQSAGTVDFDPGAGTFDVVGNQIGNWFVSELDSSGAFVWAGSGGGSGAASASCVGLGPAESIYLGGFFQFGVDFDPSLNTLSLNSYSGYGDGFVARLIMEPLISTTEPNSARLQVYPNPAHDQVQIRSTIPMQEVVLLDMSGREHHRQEMIDGLEVGLDLGALADGIYLLRIVNVQSQVETVKVLKTGN